MLKRIALVMVLQAGLVITAQADGASDLRSAQQALNDSDYEKAIHYFTGAIRWGELGQSQLKTALTNRGFAALSLGDCAGAVSDYEQVLGQSPDDSVSINNVAWALATCPDDSVRDGAKAVALAERANEISGDAYLGTLAASYAELGQFEKAVDTQQGFMQRLSDDLAEAKQRVKYNEALLAEAQGQLDAYLEVKPWRMNSPAQN